MKNKLENLNLNIVSLKTLCLILKITFFVQNKHEIILQMLNVIFRANFSVLRMRTKKSCDKL